MKMSVYYEWGVEMHEVDGDDFDTDHFATYAEAKSHYDRHRDKDPWKIVLIRNVGNADVGITDRTWAYVRDGKLDLHFCDGMDEPCYDVPKRFTAEVKRHQTKTGAAS